jgi:hypothetical protein
MHACGEGINNVLKMIILREMKKVLYLASYAHFW